MKPVVIVALSVLCQGLMAQVLISETPGSPDSTAMLEVRSTSQGLLPPRMTESQRNRILNPTPGLIIYCTDCREMQMFNDTAWTNMIGLPAASGFTCGHSLMYQGQAYATVQIGAQCWMAENLNVGTLIGGNSIMRDNGILEKYCYDDNVANCDTFGALYRWDEMMQYAYEEGTQGICPIGWHIPTDEEWQTLELELGMNADDLNLIGYRGDNQGSQLATNELLWTDRLFPEDSIGPLLKIDSLFGTSGFNALPGGQMYSPTGVFRNKSTIAHFWTSSWTDLGISSTMRGLSIRSPRVWRHHYSIVYTYSVRCLQD